MTKLDLLILEINISKVIYYMENMGFSILFNNHQQGLKIGYDSISGILYFFAKPKEIFKSMSKLEQNVFIKYVEQKFNIKINESDVE